MKIIKTARYIKIAEFSHDELREIGGDLVDLGNYSEFTGAALEPDEIQDGDNSYFVDTRYIVQLGRFLWAGEITEYSPEQEEIDGAISELQNIILINSTFAQPFDDEEIRDIKILISKLIKMKEIYA